MSYGFDMGFAQANSLQEAMAIALEYTQSQMTEKNIRKTIRDNLYYIPSCFWCFIFIRFVPGTLRMRCAKIAETIGWQIPLTGIGLRHCLPSVFCIGKSTSCSVSS